MPKINFFTHNKNYIQTYFVEFFVVLSGLLCYRYASIKFGEIGFSEYALFRRTISFIVPLVFLGLNVATTRYVSVAISNNDKAKAKSILVLSLISVVAMALFIFFILFSGKHFFAWLFFGNRNYEYLIFPISIFLIGSALHTIVYSYFRGLYQISNANLIQFINIAIGNLIGFFLFDNLTALLYFAGIFWITTSLIFLVIILFGTMKVKTSFEGQWRELMSFGLQRVPGEFFMTGLLALPSYLTTHFFSLKLAGYVAFGLALLNMASLSVYPISFVFLPKATMLISSNKIGELKQHWLKIVFISSLVAIIGVVIFQISPSFWLSLYLKNYSNELLQVSRLMILAAPAIMVFMTIRALNDAYYFLGVNTAALFIAFAFYLISFYIFKHHFILSIICFVTAIYLLMLLALFFNKRIFSKHNV